METPKIWTPSSEEIDDWRKARAGSELCELRMRVDNSGEHGPRFSPGRIQNAIGEFENIFGDRITNRFAHVSLADYNFESEFLARDLRSATRWLCGDRDDSYEYDSDFNPRDVAQLADFIAALLILDDDERLASE